MAAPGPAKLRVSDLRAALALIFDEAERLLGPTIDLDGDHYWLLEHDERYGDEPPAVSTAGSLVDDVESVYELLERDPDEGVYLWHDLSHAVGVLNRIADLDRRRFAQ
jgi:hypothetical protein